jgi:hypothetical protein
MQKIRPNPLKCLPLLELLAWKVMYVKRLNIFNLVKSLAQ